jgi:deazaflavin-dependent oxidoreductase (nitroreductase family)
MTAPGTFSAFNETLIDDFRAHGGKVTSGPFVGRSLLLLTTTGARTGASRTAPVVYTRDGDRYVIVASKGGAPTNPAWYANLVANPIVTVEVGEETFQARATVVSGAERDRLYAQHALAYPNFLDYQQRTSRVIPVVRLERL